MFSLFNAGTDFKCCGKSLLDAYFLGPYWSVHKRKFLTWLISGLKVVLVDACGVSARMG